MARVELPKPRFHVHPQGQHKGFVFEVEGPVLKDTRYGAKMKIALKIESETAMMPDDGSDYAGEPCTIWVWMTLSKSSKGNLRKYREKILNRKLNDVEAGAEDFDPEVEFVNKRIGYVVEHVPSEDPEKPYANVETFWLDDDTTPCVSRILEGRKERGQGMSSQATYTPTNSDALRDETIAYIKNMEEKVFATEVVWGPMRQRHLLTTDIDKATDQQLANYKNVFSTMGQDDPVDDLPF